MANASDPTTIVLVPALSIAKSHTGNFTQAQTGATYSLVVSNGSAAGVTSGIVTVTETAPVGLSLSSMAGTGWTCATGGNTCTRSDALAAGASYPAITVTVNVASNAPASLTNQATVSGGGSAAANASDTTTIIPMAVLTIAKHHTGNFIQGQIGATYSLTVSNGVSAGPTNSAVTVTESVPAGLTLVSLAGTGWTCPGGGTTCTRSDVLAAGASYPAITVTVNVAANAPTSLTNQVTLSGGGSAPANASDATTVNLVPVLSISKSHSGNFSQGQTGAAYSLTVSNSASAGPTNGTITVTESVPTGLTLVSMAGNGWTCPGGGATCTRSDVLGTGAIFPAIAVTVNVARNAPASLTNQVSVAGGGSVTASASDPTTVTFVSLCDVNRDGVTNVADVQLIINEALGLSPPANDLNHDGVVNVADVQIVINAALGLGCSAD
jgi:hypothetical protein